VNCITDVKEGDVHAIITKTLGPNGNNRIEQTVSERIPATRETLKSFTCPCDSLRIIPHQFGRNDDETRNYSGVNILTTGAPDS